MERAERIIAARASACCSTVLLIPVLWLMLVLTPSRPSSGSSRCGSRPRSRPSRSADRARRTRRQRAGRRTDAAGPERVAAPTCTECRRPSANGLPIADVERLDRRRQRSAGYKAGVAGRRLVPGRVADGRGAAIGLRGQLRQPNARHDGRAPPPADRPDAEGAGAAPGHRSRRSTATPATGVETFRLPSSARDDLDARLRRRRARAHRRGAGTTGNGVILALPHLGGWEWAGRWMAEQGSPDHRRGRGARAARAVRLVRRPPPELGHDVVALGPEAGQRGVAGPARQRARVPALRPRHPAAAASRSSSSASARRCPPARRPWRCAPAHRSCPTAVYFTERVNGHLAVVRPPLRPSAAASCATTSPASPRSSPASSRPDPPRPGAVAPVPAELAERPRIRRLTRAFTSSQFRRAHS